MILFLYIRCVGGWTGGSAGKVVVAIFGFVYRGVTSVAR